MKIGHRMIVVGAVLMVAVGTFSQTLKEECYKAFPDTSFYVGLCGTMYGGYIANILKTEPQIVVNGWAFKQSHVHPDNKTWDWYSSDKEMAAYKEAGAVVKIHAPAGPQVSKWAKNDSTTPCDLEINLREYLTALYSRYGSNSFVKYWDVTNEVIFYGGYKKDLPGDDQWEIPYYRIGLDTNELKTPSFIRIAWEIANRFLPKSTKLVFNLCDHTWNMKTWVLAIKTIDYLRSLGLRVDVLGIEGHWLTPWAVDSNVVYFKQLIEMANNDNLEVQISESEYYLGCHNVSSYYLQAYEYSKLIETMIPYSRKRRNGVIFWTVTDSLQWNPEVDGGLWDVKLNKKPAYYSIKDVIFQGVIEFCQE